MKKFLCSLLALIAFVGCKSPATSGKIVAHSEITNEIYFADKPIISAHRGGGSESLKGYPENCLESIQYLCSKGIQSFEIDIFESTDGDLLLMHDNKLGRTATGNGEVSAMSTAELRKVNLKDALGNVTNYRIPLLKEVLSWCKQHNAYLMLDFKKGISYQKVVDLVRAEGMEAQVVLISYNTGQAEALYKVAPEMLISVTVRNEEELERILATGIPQNKLVAFTGVKVAPESLYARLNALKIPAILGTLGNLDKRAATKGDHLYREWAQKGIQIFSTDRPLSLSF
nr:glycerophosphodiester phosphodiesterase family protein [uncultured Capnocytophaga sp.]